MAAGVDDMGQTARRRWGAKFGPGRSDVATGAARTLRSVADGRLAELPVTLRFWDDSQLPAAEPAGAAPVVFLSEPTAIAHLVHAPGQLGLVRAWLNGALELDGDLEAVLATRERFRNLRISLSERVRLVLAAFATPADSLEVGQERKLDLIWARRRGATLAHMTSEPRSSLTAERSLAGPCSECCA